MLDLRVKILKRTPFFLLIIFALYFLLTYKITDVPPGINGDEAAIGYSAALISKTGYDSEGRFFPIFSNTGGLSDWKQPITLYSTVLMFKLFGATYFNLRLTSVVIIIISFILLFLFTGRFFGTTFAIFSSLLFAVSPSILIHSHLALENVAPIPFTIIWLWMLAEYGKQNRIRYLIFSSVSLGITLYSYLGMRLVVPILFVISIIYILYANRKFFLIKKLKHLAYFLTPLVFFFIISLFLKNLYPGAILANNRPSLSGNYQDLILPYLSTFDVSFLFLKGDATAYHSTGKHGVFLLATLPLFFIGLYQSLRLRNPLLLLTISAFLSSPLLYSLTGVSYRASRLLILVPLYSIISALGLLTIIRIRSNLKRFFLSNLVVILLFFNYLEFLNYYWYQYPNMVKASFSKPLQIVFKDLFETAYLYNMTPLIQNDLAQQDFNAFYFFEQTYPKIERWVSNSTAVPKSSVLLADPGGITHTDTKNLKIVNIDETGYILVINEIK